MAVLLKKIEGSTLVETLVALTIISLVSGFAMVIFLMVSSPGSSIGPMMIAQQNSAEMLDTLNPEHIQTADLRMYKKGLTFSRSVEQEGINLYRVTVEVSDADEQLIYTRKRLLYAKD